MKFLVVAYSEGLDDEVMEVLAEAGVESYTKWTKVLGKGQTSGPHLASHVWPKANNVMALAVEEPQAQLIMAGVRKLREDIGREGVKAFLLPLEGLT